MGEERIGFCLTASAAWRHRDWLPLATAVRRGVIHRGFLLHPEDRASIRAPSVFIVPLGLFMKDMQDWILNRRTMRTAREAVWRINRERLAACAAHR